MRSTVLILALIGCGNPELESENTDLKAKVEDLEKSEAKLKKKVESLKTKLATTERALTALQQAETYGKLGIEAGDALAVRFHTSLGKINCSLMPDVAPKTVLNFVHAYVRGLLDPRVALEHAIASGIREHNGASVPSHVDDITDAQRGPIDREGIVHPVWLTPRSEVSLEKAPYQTASRAIARSAALRACMPSSLSAEYCLSAAKASSRSFWA